MARGAHRRGRVLVGIPKGKRPSGRPGSRRKDNTKMGLKEIGWGGGEFEQDLSMLGQGRVADCCEHFGFHKKAGILLLDKEMSSSQEDSPHCSL
jgi:hypothetical protein